MTDTTELQESIYQEMRGKIKEDDAQAPQRKGPFFYYTKNLEGEQYVVHCRRMAPGGEGPGHIDEVMETGSGAPEEEVLLDENEEGRKQEFYHVGEVKVKFVAASLVCLEAHVYRLLGRVLAQRSLLLLKALMLLLLVTRYWTSEVYL